MMQDANKLLREVLDIIEFEDNKDQFIEEFFKLAQQQAILGSINSLPQPQQDTVKDKLKEAQPDRVMEIILEYISQEDLAKAVTSSTESIFREYLEAVVPTLSQDQKNKIGDLFASLNSAQA